MGKMSILVSARSLKAVLQTLFAETGAPLVVVVIGLVGNGSSGSSTEPLIERVLRSALGSRSGEGEQQVRALADSRSSRRGRGSRAPLPLPSFTDLDKSHCIKFGLAN